MQQQDEQRENANQDRGNAAGDPPALQLHYRWKLPGMSALMQKYDIIQLTLKILT